MKKFMIILSSIAVILSVVVSSTTIAAWIKPKVKKLKDGAEPLPSMAIERDAALTDSGNPYEIADDPNTTKNGTLFSTDTMTGYFMEITGLAGNKCRMSDDHGDFAELDGYWGKAKTRTVTALFTFTDVKYNNAPVFVSALTTTKAESHWFTCKLYSTLQEDFTETNDNALRIPASYYNFLLYEKEHTGASFNRIKIMLVWNGNKGEGYKYEQTCRVRLYTKDIPVDSDDPASPNFKLDNWSGLMAMFKTNNAGLKTWQKVLIYLGIAFIVIIILRLIFGSLK